MVKRPAFSDIALQLQVITAAMHRRRVADLKKPPPPPTTTTGREAGQQHRDSIYLLASVHGVPDFCVVFKNT
jgi:hypothetical protein